MAQKTIAVIGALAADYIIIADHFPDVGESLLANEYVESLGGKGANSAIAAYRTCHNKPVDLDEVAEPEGQQKQVDGLAGGTTFPASFDNATVISANNDDIQVKMIGALGNDRWRDPFITALQKNGVDVSGVRTIPDVSSSLCFVMVENDTRENRILINPGATGTWKKEDFQTVESLGHGIRPDLIIAQMEIDKEVVEAMIETAGEAGIEVLLNAAPAHPVTKRACHYITHLLVNESEAAIMSGRYLHEVNQATWPVIAQEFLDWGIQNVVITLGGQGAFYATPNGSGHCAGYQVTVQDSTGAGDTFTGTYASDYLRQKKSLRWDIKSAVARANKAAAMAIQKVGAQGGIPWADEIDRFDAPLRDVESAPLPQESGHDVPLI